MSYYLSQAADKIQICVIITNDLLIAEHLGKLPGSEINCEIISNLQRDYNYPKDPRLGLTNFSSPFIPGQPRE